MNKRLSMIAVIVIATGAAAWGGIQLRQVGATIPAVRVVQAQPMIQRLVLVGRIDPAISATLAAPFDGDVSKVMVEIGQVVGQGDALFELDATALSKRIYEADLDALKARRAASLYENWQHSPEVVRANRAVVAAKAQLADSERKLSDARLLLEQGIIAKMEVDGLALQVDTATMATSIAEDERKFLLERRDDLEAKLVRDALNSTAERRSALRTLLKAKLVTAPFSGIVVKQAHSGTDEPERALLGKSVLRGQPILGLMSDTQVKATANIDETDLSKLRVGQPVEITGDAFAGLTLSGSISTLGAKALPGMPDGGAARYEITVAIPPLSSDQRHLIRLGMSTNLAITTYANPHSVLLPPNAIQQIKGKSYVELAKPGTTRRLVEVSTGRSFSAGIETIGLTQGTHVVVPGSVQ